MEALEVVLLVRRMVVVVVEAETNQHGIEAELAKEINRPSEVFDDDSYVVHPLERHVSNLQGVAWSSPIH